MHIFRSVKIGHECNNTAIYRLAYRKTGFLEYLALHAVVGALAWLKFATDTNPFVLIHVVFLFYTVHHEICSVFFYVA